MDSSGCPRLPHSCGFSVAGGEETETLSMTRTDPTGDKGSSINSAKAVATGSSERTGTAVARAPQKSAASVGASSLKAQPLPKEAVTAADQLLAEKVAGSAGSPLLEQQTTAMRATFQSPTELSVSVARTSQALVIAVLFLTFAGATVQFFKYALKYDYLLGLFDIFNLNSETGVGSWFAAVALLLCSALLALIFSAKRRERDKFVYHWGMLALVFLYLSIDEGSRIHETIGNTLALKVTGVTSGWLHYTWVIYGAALVLVVGLSYLRFLAHLSTKMKRLFFLAGLLYVGGALGMEVLCAKYYSLHGSQNLTYQMMAVVEECLEMTGITVFIYALLIYIASESKGLRVRLERKDPREAF